MQNRLVTNKPENQATPGRKYAYVKLAGYGKMKCAGMIADDQRQFYAEHFAGLQEHKPTCPQNVQQGEQSLLMFAPEYVGDQVMAEDLREIALAIYQGGKLAS